MGGRSRTGFRIICRERRGHRVSLGPGSGRCHPYAGGAPGEGVSQCGRGAPPWGQEPPHSHCCPKNRDNGRRRRPGSRAGLRTDTHLTVGGWGLRGGHLDPLCRGTGEQLRGPQVSCRGVLFLLSAAAAEVLRQAADAHDGHNNQEDDDEDPGVRDRQHHPESAGHARPTSLPPRRTHGSRAGSPGCPVWPKPPGGLCPEELALGSPQGAREELILLAAAVTTAFESFGAASAGGGRERPSLPRWGGRGMPASSKCTRALRE